MHTTCHVILTSFSPDGRARYEIFISIFDDHCKFFIFGIFTPGNYTHFSGIFQVFFLLCFEYIRTMYGERLAFLIILALPQHFYGNFIMKYPSNLGIRRIAFGFF